MVGHMDANSKCPTCFAEMVPVKARTLYMRCYICKPARRKTGQDRPCRWCGQAFYVPGHFMKQGRGIYCSHECRVADICVATPEGYKHCFSCGVTKALDEFAVNRTKSDGRQVKCRACQTEYNREREGRPEVARVRFSQHLQRKYGITIDEYEAMVNRQGGVCAICKGLPTSGPGARNERFDVDHCHETGMVRGALCSDCNTGLGRFRDDVDRMKAAIAYLQK